MSADRKSGLFGRVKRTLDLLRSPAGVRNDGRSIAPVLKLNIAPLMGRRDAAIDQAANFIGTDIFTLQEGRRINHYAHICRLLELAMNDCDQIITGLSSQDTLTREKRLRAFLSMLYSMSLTIKDSTMLENVILSESPDVLRGLADIARRANFSATLGGVAVLDHALGERFVIHGIEVFRADELRQRRLHRRT